MLATKPAPSTQLPSPFGKLSLSQLPPTRTKQPNPPKHPHLPHPCTSRCPLTSRVCGSCTASPLQGGTTMVPRKKPHTCTTRGCPSSSRCAFSSRCLQGIGQRRLVESDGKLHAMASWPAGSIRHAPIPSTHQNFCSWRCLLRRSSSVRFCLKPALLTLTACVSSTHQEERRGGQQATRVGGMCLLWAATHAPHPAPCCCSSS